MTAIRSATRRAVAAEPATRRAAAESRRNTPQYTAMHRNASQYAAIRQHKGYMYAVCYGYLPLLRLIAPYCVSSREGGRAAPRGPLYAPASSRPPRLPCLACVCVCVVVVGVSRLPVVAPPHLLHTHPRTTTTTHAAALVSRRRPLAVANTACRHTLCQRAGAARCGPVRLLRLSLLQLLRLVRLSL